MYKFKYISIGIISTVPLYYLWNPVNRFINRTSNNFDNSTIDTKFAIYESLPTIDETKIKAYVKLKQSNDNNWNRNCDTVFNKMDNIVYKFYKKIQNNLIDEIKKMDNKTKLLHVNKIYHNSFELKYNIQNILKDELQKNKIIETTYLDDLHISDRIESVDLICMKYLILSYPNKNDILNIIENILNNTNNLDDKNVNRILNYINKFDKPIKLKLCEEILTEMFHHINKDDEYIKLLFQNSITDIIELKGLQLVA
jgi:hypothetical protein